MAHLRAVTRRALHDVFGDAVAQAGEESPLGEYVARHGVAHLLVTERKVDAERALLDVEFMAAFCDAWPTVMMPLADVASCLQEPVVMTGPVQQSRRPASWAPRNHAGHRYPPTVANRCTP